MQRKHSSCVSRICEYNSSSLKKQSLQNSHNGWMPPSIWSFGMDARCCRCIDGRWAGRIFGGYSACSCEKTFFERIHRSLFIIINQSIKQTLKTEPRENIPHKFSMRSANMQLQITPAVPYIVAVWIGAVEPQQDKRLLHHIARLEIHRELRILKGHSTQIKRRKLCVGRRRVDNRRLWLLGSPPSKPDNSGS